MHVGDNVRLKLRGKKSIYEVAGTIEALESGMFELRLADARVIRIPQDAVLEAEIHDSGPAKPSRPGAANIAADPALVERETAWCTFIRQRTLGHGRNVSVESLEAVNDYISGLIRSEGDSAIRNMLGQIASAFELIRIQWLEFTYDRRVVHHAKVKNALIKAAESCRHARLTQLEAVLFDLQRICEDEQKAFQRQATAHIRLVNSLAGEPHHLRPDRTFELIVGVSTDPSDPPISAVRVLVRVNNDVQTGGISKSRPQRLTGGQRGEYSIPLLASASAFTKGEANIAMQVKYRRHDGVERQTPQERTTVLLQLAQEFTQIRNHYARFSGGAVVDDAQMFFGRDELVNRMLSVITQGTSGQCFVLYGQKRTGKSSVLRHMAKRLPRPFLPIQLSLGQTDTTDAGVSFIQQCIDEVYNVLVRDFGMQDLAGTGWPSEQRIATRPLESFRRAFFAATTRLSKLPAWRNCRPVLLIDEFTYMYEYIVEGRVDASFMRQWKALLETGLFSAVIVGQDSMSKFKLAFPNEFGVTHDERITYLTREEARRFAEKPIMLADGSSRFRGFALDRLVDLTAGNPFFQMIFCDRLVRHLNETRSSYIVEGTVERVLHRLCSGESALPLDRFDSLITAAGESVSLAPREEYLSLLFKVATAEGGSSGVDMAELALDDNEVELLHDLVLREVVARDSTGRIRIRVALFAEWLRQNANGKWTFL